METTKRVYVLESQIERLIWDMDAFNKENLIESTGLI